MHKTALLLAPLALLACTGKYVRETTAEKIEATPERIARGQYLVNNIGACGACHTSRDMKEAKDFILNGEKADAFLGGNHVKIEGLAEIWIPNITPDVETGIGGWSDDEIVRAIRDGVTRHGDLMFPMMPFTSYQYMSDDDVRAVVAYLRTVPPYKQTMPRVESDLGFMGNLFLFTFGVAAHEPAREVKAPDKSDKLKYGEYVMRMGHCWECHSSSGQAPRGPDDELYMAGFGDEADPFLEDIMGKIYMRNLTPDEETGLGKYSAEQIKEAMKTGKRLDGKKMAPPMSMMIPHYSGMSEEDLDALVTFLKSLKPVKNKIPDRELKPEYEQLYSAAN